MKKLILAGLLASLSFSVIAEDCKTLQRGSGLTVYQCPNDTIVTVNNSRETVTVCKIDKETKAPYCSTTSMRT